MNGFPAENTESQYLKLDRDASIVGKTAEEAHFQKKLFFGFAFVG